MLNRKKDTKDGKFSQVVSNSLDMKLRWHFGCVCSDGSIETARIFVNGFQGQHASL